MFIITSFPQMIDSFQIIEKVPYIAYGTFSIIWKKSIIRGKFFMMNMQSMYNKNLTL